MREIVDFFLHLDKHLAGIIQDHGTYTYAILFSIIFCETGFVVTPFLPGDSLLFAAGAFSARPEPVRQVGILYFLLTFAALLGDHCNYWIGRYFGPNLFGRFVNKRHMDRTHEFYEKHGVLTLVIAQFVPIIRTFAPFVAGVGDMTYAKFSKFNFIGVMAWTTLFIWAGYFFGNLEFVQKNFHYVILAIIAISVLPIMIEVARSIWGGKKRKKR